MLKLVGSTAQLGGWQPANGLTLYTNEKEFPIWQAGILLDPGFDDFEWGVTLFGVHADDLKDVVYTMRFDEASAKYADFGSFYVGIVTPVEDRDLKDKAVIGLTYGYTKAHDGISKLYDNLTK